MKSTKEFRGQGGGFGTDDAAKKAMKLEPIRKSGKDKHHLYEELDEESPDLMDYRKKESVLDYYDDEDDL